MWLLGANADLLGSYQRRWKRSLYSCCSFADKPNVCIFIYFFLQLTFPIPSLQSKRVHVSFINCAKAADNNLEEYNPDAYHLVWTLALATACLISLTHTAQPAPSASWALCLRPQWDFHLDQAPSCLQEHSSYNVLLSAVLLASDCSEGLGSTGPALLIYQFLSCFSTLLFPLQLYCVFCLCSFV